LRHREERVREVAEAHSGGRGQCRCLDSCALRQTSGWALLKGRIAVEKLWRDAQVAILFGKALREAAFATNDSGRYWRVSGARQCVVGKPSFRIDEPSSARARPDCPVTALRCPEHAAPHRRPWRVIEPGVDLATALCRGRAVGGRGRRRSGARLRIPGLAAQSTRTAAAARQEDLGERGAARRAGIGAAQKTAISPLEETGFEHSVPLREASQPAFGPRLAVVGNSSDSPLEGT
jgi:hypothetical protein